MGVVVKIMGLTDIIVACILAFVDLPIIGVFKWVLIGILLLKGIPSLFG
ncbi:MAG: hypothetical protein QW625_00535 [Candidatus Nanoarchaeia archaeon]